MYDAPAEASWNGAKLPTSSSQKVRTNDRLEKPFVKKVVFGKFFVNFAVAFVDILQINMNGKIDTVESILRIMWSRVKGYGIPSLLTENVVGIGF
jgi:hypothetical protein